MPLPAPEPGLVLSYSYLWKRQEKKGREEGEKARPCVIILATKISVSETSTDETVVTVVPVTSQPPEDSRAAVAIPPKVKQHLGLDSAPAWVIADEINRFIWPGPDLRPIPGQAGRFDYGFVPPRLYAAIKAALLNLHRARRLRAVDRTP